MPTYLDPDDDDDDDDDDDVLRFAEPDSLTGSTLQASLREFDWVRRLAAACSSSPLQYWASSIIRELCLNLTLKSLHIVLCLQYRSYSSADSLSVEFERGM